MLGEVKGSRKCEGSALKTLMIYFWKAGLRKYLRDYNFLSGHSLAVIIAHNETSP